METNKEMAEYIYSILQSDRKVMWSWGFRKPTIVEGGLKFKVSGFIFKGWVQVTYNAGADLFDIKLITVTGVEKLSLDHVYFDELITVIDNYVERVDNYEDVVREKYFGGKEGFSS